MKSTSTILFLFLTFTAIAQPQIEFDTTKFDFGKIVEAGTIKKTFEFTNIGNQPLIIRRAVTGDGGSMASFSKEPILPNKKGSIVFYYNSKRIGRFQKCIRIESNAKKTTYNCAVRVKGEVIRKPTTIEARQQTIDIGAIEFKDMKTVSFEIKNTGTARLYLGFDRWKYPEMDLFYCRIEPLDIITKTESYKQFYEPNETVQITFALRNVYGDAGNFERNFTFIYNNITGDTLNLTIKGQFVGKPKRTKIYESNCVFMYNDKQLLKKITYSGSGNLQREDFFENAYCVHSKIYNTYPKAITERFYKKGVLMETKVVKLK